MKNLSTFLAMFLLGWSVSTAAITADDQINRGYNNSFIFLEGGIEFAVFPDGQFDFNYLDRAPQIAINWNTPHHNFSFNSGYNYDRFVQYDIYGAVIQIENTPIFYDPYGRVQQIGNIYLDYRNGYVHRIGGLQIFYSRPGVVVNYVGFINNFNRYYVYQPWHDFYRVPVIDRCLVWQRPYRRYYNPIRYTWAYHNNYWNHPGYYNGRFLRASERRNFYRPHHRVRYNSFERGRRDRNGRAIAYNTRARSVRESIATGRRDVRSYDTGRATNTTSRIANERSNANLASRSSTATARSNNYSRSSENVRTINNRERSTSRRSSAAVRSNAVTDTASANRSSRSTINTTRATTPSVRSVNSSTRSNSYSQRGRTTNTRSTSTMPAARRSANEASSGNRASRSGRN